MSLRQTTGSVVCPSCGRLVGVKEGKCPNCGRPNPGMWGFTQVLRSLGQDMGLSAIVTTGCTVLFLLALALDPSGINLKSLFGFLAPSIESSFVLGASGPVPVFQYGRWWTVLTASWLHGSLLHIFFNMMWIRQLAPAVAHLYGPGRATVI
ncbi:MAG: rhomboid family intramembrane serine protease, partial [Thermoanaerobaculia bacterium]|nr:rhomboid family intramembrane serine protease [Thermoanaerobaculia bacterium]